VTTSRLEAFSDGVIAIIITIMVLELKIPHGSDISALRPVLPAFIAYIVSFVFLGIYWNNHHHMLQATQRVGGGVLWANSHLLFWLSLVPAATAWIGENPRASWPSALYGIIFVGAAVAYTILQRSIIAFEGPQSTLASAVGSDRKGKVSTALYLAAIPLAFVHPWLSDAIYAVVAIIWLAPDPRIEQRLQPASPRAAE
jgi:uncharacterized membrane protein